MSFPITRVAAGIDERAAVERPGSAGAADPETEKQRLKKAAREFESLFMYEMLKTMRKTVPKDSSPEKAGFANDLGKDTFMQMFDIELARMMAEGGRGSISDVLYHSLKGVIEAQYDLGHSPTTIRSLKRPSKESMPLDRDGRQISLPHREPIPVGSGGPRYLGIASTKTEPAPDSVLTPFGRHIEEAARQTSLDPTLIRAVIHTESDGDPRAVSPAGAKGLMQLTDSTLQDYGVSQAFDPKENILAGSRYLKHLLDRFGDLKLALAAYNAGPRNVERYNGVPPFSETIAYVDRVMGRLASLRGALVREAKGHHENVR